MRKKSQGKGKTALFLEDTSVALLVLGMDRNVSFTGFLTPTAVWLEWEDFDSDIFGYAQLSSKMESQYDGDPLRAAVDIMAAFEKTVR